MLHSPVRSSNSTEDDCYPESEGVEPAGDDWEIWRLLSAGRGRGGDDNRQLRGALVRAEPVSSGTLIFKVVLVWDMRFYEVCKRACYSSAVSLLWRFLGRGIDAVAIGRSSK